MKIFSPILILLFIPIVSIAQQIKGIERYELDTIQTVSKDIKTYEFNLEGPSQGLYLGQLQSNSLPYIELKVMNNAGQDVTISYRIRDCGVTWFPMLSGYETVATGESFFLKSGWIISKLGPISCLIEINYFFPNGEKSRCLIHTWGEMKPSEIKTITKIDTATVASSKINNDIVISSKQTNHEKSEKSQPSTSLQSQRPNGVECFGKGNLHLYDPTKSRYEFRIEKNDLHNSEKPRGVNDIFSWDTLTSLHSEKEYIFSFKNHSEYPMFILDVAASSPNFIVKDIGKKMLLPDSITEIKFHPNSNSLGHFYGGISIYYLRNGKYEYYDMGMWGFQPQTDIKLNKSQYQNRTDTIALFLVDKKFATLGDLSLKIRQKDSIYFPDFRIVNKEFVSYSTLKYNDTIWYEIRDKKNFALAKGYVTRDPKVHNIFIQVNELKNEPHTYYRSLGRIKYTVIEDVYFIKWNNSFKREEVLNYLSSKGLDIDYSCQGYITLKDKNKAIQLQNEIIKSKYQLVLLPIVSHSDINEYGWGGACEYYDNVFSIEFYHNTTKKKIDSIFKQFGITNYVSQGKNELGLNRYSFSVNTLIDLKYMSILDKLWNLPEVFGLTQDQISVGGLD